MKCLGRAVLILVAIIIVAAVAWFLLSRAGTTADLASLTTDVQMWDARASQAESVPTGERRKMRDNDGVRVNSSGRARLSAEQCVWDIFRDTDLRVEHLPSQSAKVCAVQLSHGTIDNKVETETIVDTDWAVITALGTRFLVYVDPDRGLLWVIVAEGVVQVEAAGQTVRLGAGEQTWVLRGQPPEPPRPALRSEVGEMFPPISVLTNRELSDGDLLLPEQTTPPLAPLGLQVAHTPDEVIAGECSGPHTAQITANVTGDDRFLADVAQALVHYQWEASVELVANMERVDDRTFLIEIGPFDYCCQQTAVVYTVELLNPEGHVMATESGRFLLSFCIG
jgi:hypothetical protein